MSASPACLACGSKERELVLDLGRTPLANSNVLPERAGAAEPRYPLQLLFCRACGLVQLSELVPPELLFSDYVYMTGASSTMVAHFGAFAVDAVRRFALGPRDLVVEIASNDGTLLAAFRALGVRVLGIEPAANLCRVAEEKSVESLARFFSETGARTLREERGPAALVCGNNVLAHVPDLLGVLRGARILTEPAGVVSIEVPWLFHLVERLEYDTVYHEHLSYFSLGALAGAFARAGLALFDVQELAVHGGSLRLLARAGVEHGPALAPFLARERALGLERAETYHAFARRVAANRTALRALLERLRAGGRRIAAYGAPAKGNTLLNYCGIGPELVEYTVDRNPMKVGKLTPGAHLPIRPVPVLAEDCPDYALILPWNIADEIVAQEAAYRGKGGRFLVPIPEPKVL
jgi:SAM-dependent methyltransferase